MISALIIFFLTVALPVFFGSWRTAVFGFGLQSLLTGVMLLIRDEVFSASFVVQLVDLFLLRGLIVPWAVIHTLKKTENPSVVIDLVPENLIHWIVALVIIISAYCFGNVVFPTDFISSVQLGTVSSVVLIGLLVLATQTAPAGQIIGALFLESGITLSEILKEHQTILPIQIALTLVFLLSIFIFLNLINRFPHFESLPTPSEQGDVI